jgi:hypothetical protein
VLICADGGGSDGYRTRLWKTELAALAPVHRPDHHRLPPATRHLEMEQGTISTGSPIGHQLENDASSPVHKGEFK